MKQAFIDEPHAEWLVQIEVIDAKEFDIVLGRRKESVLDLHTLRCNAVSHGQASDPIEHEGDAEGEDDNRPLTRARDRLRSSYEELPLDLGLFGVLEGRQIGVAEPTLDGGDLDELAADRARLGIVSHASLAFSELSSGSLDVESREICVHDDSKSRTAKTEIRCSPMSSCGSD